MRKCLRALRWFAFLAAPSAFACTLSISPSTVTVAASGVMAFTAKATSCSGTLSYAWKTTVPGGSIPNTNTTISTLTAPASAASGTVTVVLTFGGGTKTTATANVTVNLPLTAGFFGMDINQTTAVGVPSGESDPWPSNGGGVNFGTYRTLGSSIKWSDLVVTCPAAEGDRPTYIFDGSNATTNRLYKWLSQAFVGGQKVMFTAYYTPNCSAFSIPYNSSQPCAYSADVEGCYLPGDVSTTDTTWKGFINDLLTYLNTTTFSDGKTKLISQLGYLEIWNEPNIGTECDGTDHNYSAGVTGLGNCTAPNLATITSDAYQAVQTFNKANSTSVKVISPAVTAASTSEDCIQTAPEPSSFFTTILDDIASTSTGTKSMDYIGFHGYVELPTNTTGAPDPAAGASCIGQLITNVQLAATSANSGFTQPLYQTEGSWGASNSNSLITSSADNGGTGREQAFTGIYNLAQAEYAFTTLQGFNWYGWDFQTSADTGAPSTGQYWDEAGSGSLAPGGTAYLSLYNWLAGTDLSTGFSAPVAPCAAQNGTTVWTCQFVFPNGKFGLVVWDNNGTCSGATCPATNTAWPVPLTPAGLSYAKWRDLNGDPAQTLGTTVSISLQPILINN